MNIQPFTIQSLVSNAQYYETVRALRWAGTVKLPKDCSIGLKSGEYGGKGNIT